MEGILIFSAKYRYLFIPSIAWILSQLIKGIVETIRYKEFNISRFVGSGGIPSSHSALVSSLTTVCGITNGIQSFEFGVTLVMALIVMYDAAGVRRAAGKQAKIINQILHTKLHDLKIEETLKELIGHTPFEVLAGALFGISVAVALL